MSSKLNAHINLPPATKADWDEKGERVYRLEDETRQLTTFILDAGDCLVVGQEGDLVLTPEKIFAPRSVADRSVEIGIPVISKDVPVYRHEVWRAVQKEDNIKEVLHQPIRKKK